MARMTGSWLSGPSAAIPDGQRKEQAYQGENLGLPRSGPGSLAPTPRRVVAMFLDWVMSLGVAALILGSNAVGGWFSTLTLAVWFVIGVTTVALFQFTPGQFVMGMQVMRIDGPYKVGFVRALARNVFTTFVVPAVITDVDGRGMHDRATGTALVLTR